MLQNNNFPQDEYCITSSDVSLATCKNRKEKKKRKKEKTLHEQLKVVCPSSPTSLVKADHSCKSLQCFPL